MFLISTVARRVFFPSSYPAVKVIGSIFIIYLKKKEKKKKKRAIVCGVMQGSLKHESLRGACAAPGFQHGD